ncbi:hypothetical protein [Pseudomonas syringae group genomosp. 3]|uniref:Uncharacterized protein n=1 Tax=Pseudomonas syringae pv. maculicola TaxID=59511 RepID=A0A0N0FZK5_PSEYM|nr:hypothetical protein [Pseudomonas syringae group genomosp. 3]KPB95725.1 Uncharacterized protein AC503_3049 [Pseudomonas syringae pv. maculicola]RMV44468.1 hypothetical protein ALP13_102747 [Pseudomonas syringae pv. maculicola]
MRKPSIKPTVIDEAYMEQFDNEQLTYMAWANTDLAQEILFDDESCADCTHEAKFEVAHASMALRVLVRRLSGMDAQIIQKQLLLRQLEPSVTKKTQRTMPAWETLQ